MSKYCPKCGAEVTEGVKFCGSCGAKFEGEPWTIPEPMPAAPIPPPPPQPQYVQPPPQPQGYAPMPPKKSNAKLLGAVIAIIVIVAVVCVVLFFVLGGSGGALVGTWENEVGGMTTRMKLNGDNSVEMSIEMGGQSTPFAKVGTWKEEGGQLCLTTTSSEMGVSEGTQCYDYELSNGSNTLTLTYEGQGTTTWTKK